MYDELPGVVARREAMVEITKECAKVVRVGDEVQAAMRMNALREKGVPGPTPKKKYSKEELAELERKVRAFAEEQGRVVREANEIRNAARKDDPAIRKLADEIIEKQYLMRAKLDGLQEVRSLHKERARLITESKRVAEQLGALQEKAGDGNAGRKTASEKLGRDEKGRFNG